MRDYQALEFAAARARACLDGLPARAVGRPADITALRDRLDGPFPEDGEDPGAVIEALAAAADPGIVAGWSTTDDDIARSAEAILAAFRAEAGA